MKRFNWLMLVVALLLPFSVAAQQVAPPAPPHDLTVAQKIFGLTRLWEEVKWGFANPDRLRQVNWDSTYQAFIPQVTETKSLYDYYRTLQRFMALLQEGHTHVVLPPSLLAVGEFSAPPVAVGPIGRRAVITDVDRSLARLLPIGSEIVRVDDIPTEEYLRTRVFPFIAAGTDQARWYQGVTGRGPGGIGLLTGAWNSGVRITARTPDGRMRDVRVTRAGTESPPEKWARRTTPRQIVEYRELRDGIAYVAINSFESARVVEKFDSLAPILRQSGGVILDVRNNDGGNGRYAIDLIRRHLGGGAVLTARWKTRVYNMTLRATNRPIPGTFRDSLGENWQTQPPDTIRPDPSLPKIQAPLIVLTGARTGSSAEDFVMYLDAASNVTIIGEPTAGSTGSQQWFDLPGGGRGRVLVKRDSYPDGREFVGSGIQPDIPVSQTVRGIVENRDLVLEKAVDVLSSMLRPSRARR